MATDTLNFDPTLWAMESMKAEGPASAARTAERGRWFDKVATRPDWKLPIHAVIAAEDFMSCDAASIHFTGSSLSVQERLRDGRLIVTAPGYYAVIGA